MAPLSREELKEILIACVRLRRQAASIVASNPKPDKNMKQSVANMMAFAQNATTTAQVRAGTFMFNNVNTEVDKFFSDEAVDIKNLLEDLLTKKEDKDVIN
jgi:hypothetical protein